MRSSYSTRSFHLILALAMAVALNLAVFPSAARAASNSVDLKITPTRGEAPLNVMAYLRDNQVSCPSYTIDWGDGSAVTTVSRASDSCSSSYRAGAVFSSDAGHSYATSGTYTIKANYNGRDYTKKLTVTAARIKDPSFSVTPARVAASTTVTAKLSAPGTCIGSYTIDWGDGDIYERGPIITLECASAKTNTHAYSDVGTYSVKVTMGDFTKTEKVRVTEKQNDHGNGSDNSSGSEIQRLKDMIEKLIEQLRSAGITPSISTSTIFSLLPTRSDPIPPSLSTSGTSSCSWFGRTLHRGSKDADTDGSVTWLQKYLSSAGDYTYPSFTGFFGEETEKALQKWQSRHGIVTSGNSSATGWGVFGPLTRDMMSSACRNGN